MANTKDTRKEQKKALAEKVATTIYSIMQSIDEATATKLRKKVDKSADEISKVFVKELLKKEKKRAVKTSKKVNPNAKGKKVALPKSEVLKKETEKKIPQKNIHTVRARKTTNTPKTSPTTKKPVLKSSPRTKPKK